MESAVWKVHKELFEKLQSVGYGDEAAKQFFKDHEQQMLVGSGVLWPEKEDYYTLKMLQADKGMKWFKCVKQNCPNNSFFPDYSQEEIQAVVEWLEQEDSEEKTTEEQDSL